MAAKWASKNGSGPVREDLIMAIRRKEIVDAAVSCGLVDPSTGENAATVAVRTMAELVETLSLRGRAPAEAFYRAVAQRRGLPFVNVNHAEPALDLIAKLPMPLLRRACILPVHSDDGEVLVAAGDPDDSQSLDVVRRVLGARPLRVAMAEPDALSATLERVLDELAPDRSKSREAVTLRTDPVELLDRIFKEAYLRRASDIHLEPVQDGMRVRLRVDGILHEVLGGLTVEQRASLISRVKVLSELDIAEQRAPQDGGFNYRMAFAGDEEIDIRVATLPTEWGERATLRLLGAETRDLTLEALGMEAVDLGRFREVIHRPYGMLLLTGPTGSGKTTTLYGAIREINRPGINILTVEDPVEYRIPGVSQVHVGGTNKVSFSGALRAFLRHDPDVLMVGEIRDAETANAAVKAAMTGHFVLSTLHTNYACGAVTRLADIGCPTYLVAATLRGVVAQRLVRRLCPQCKEERAATPKESAFLRREEARVSIPRGCANCVGTGYRGRIGLFETLWIDGELSKLIARCAVEEEFKEATGDRLKTLAEDAREKVLAGIITVEEAIRATVMGD
jgi:type IV pilus assembly protein PilB